MRSNFPSRGIKTTVLTFHRNIVKFIYVCKNICWERRAYTSDDERCAFLINSNCIMISLLVIIINRCYACLMLVFSTNPLSPEIRIHSSLFLMEIILKIFDENVLNRFCKITDIMYMRGINH